MKIAILFILVLSALCDLEAKEQSAPIIPESQKNDIVIPTSGPAPIKVQVNDNVKSINVDGHQISYSNGARPMRKLNTLVRRRPVVRKAQDDEEYISSEEHNEGEEPHEEYYEEEGPSEEHYEEQGPSEEQYEESEPQGEYYEESHEEGSGEQGDHYPEQEENTEEDQGSYYNNYEEGNGEEQGEYQPDDSASNEQCPELNTQEHYENALHNTFSNDVQVLSAEVEEIDGMISNLDELQNEGNFTLPVGAVEAIVSKLQELAEFKAKFQCHNQGAGESQETAGDYYDDNNEYSEEQHGQEDYYQDEAADDQESHEEEHSGDHEEIHGEEEVDSHDQSEAVHSEETGAEETGEYAGSEEERKKRRAHRIRSLNALHRANQILKARIARQRPHNFRFVRKNQMVNKNHRVFVRRHLVHAPVRPGLRIRRVVRRAAQRVYRPVRLVKGTVPNRFHRYA